jgi:hypothetical protein
MFLAIPIPAEDSRNKKARRPEPASEVGGLGPARAKTYDHACMPGEPLSQMLRSACLTLSDSQQAIKNQTDAAQLNLGTLANTQSSFAARPRTPRSDPSAAAGIAGDQSGKPGRQARQP